MNRSARQSRTRVQVSTLVLATVLLPAIGAAAVVATTPATAAAAPTSSSAVTLTAADQDPEVAEAPFPDLSVTVSQTTDLVAQGIRLTYAGGVQSTAPSQQTGGANFLQVMQCWGDLEDAAGELVLDAQGRPQPDRTTCQYGATGSAGQSRTATKASTEFVSAEDEQYLYPGNGIFDPPQVSIPFRAVNGTVLQRIADGKVVSETDIDNNEFFTKNTTNEIPWAGFGANGAGTSTFEVQTNAQAPGLGCGNPVTASDGAVAGRSCWLVVVPRGDHDLGEQLVTKSGLLWETWKHRLAVKLEFKPLGVRCAIGAAEKLLAGSELMTSAVASWQPKLCGSTDGSIFNLIVANEADQALAANGTDADALALTSRALAVDDVADALTYAPVAVSGLAIGFAIDHRSDVLREVPEEVKEKDYQPLTGMNLTPRLVAKLLTDSYKSSLPTAADLTHLKDNPQYLWQDPDFLAVNDEEWKYQNLSDPSHLADLLVPLGRSDAAWVLWQYVLSDPEAVAFLAGTADEWGMVVNPYSATSVSTNPTGTAASYPRDSFPKADPTSYTPDGMGEINLVTWRPYSNDLDTSGYWVLRGDNRSLDQASWNVVDPQPKYSLAPRSLAGNRRVIGLTDTASAAKYQIFTAALRNPAGEFVVPTAESMSAAAAAMSVDAEQPQVRSFDLSSASAKAAEDAYPLTMPVYAATNPAGGDAATRAAYAAFIRYAVTKGQTPGSDDGQLPAGYAPLPDSWVADAEKAAATIAAGPQPAPTTAPATTSAGAVQVSRDVTGAGTVGVPDAAEVPVEAPATGTPLTSGDAAGALLGPATPDDPAVGVLRAVVPVGAAAGVLAAAGVPLVTRLRRVT